LYALEEDEEGGTDLLIRMLKKKGKSQGGGGSGYDLDPAEYYSEDSWLVWLRVSYCILIMNVSVKVINVAQFNDSIAFLVKILEEVFSVIKPFLVLWLCMMFMFSLIINILDVVFFNSDASTIYGDYEGFFGIIGAILLFTLRISVGDFTTDTIKFLPLPQRITMWVIFLIILVVNVLIFMNFVIALINDTFGDCSENAAEESFQKKCAILCELNSVFGSIA